MGWQDRTFYRQDRQPPMVGGWGSGSVVWWLIGVNCLVFVVDSILRGSRRAAGAAPSVWGNFNVPDALFGGQVWRILTYQFVHANFWHLLINMMSLYFFAPIMEGWFGSRRFLVFYLLCGMSGAVVFSAASAVPGLLPPNSYVLVGASGAALGTLLAAAMVAPRQRAMLIFPPIPMSLRTLALFLLAFSILSLLVGGEQSGGEAAHLGGMALAAVLVKWPFLLGWADPAGTAWGSNLRRRLRRRKARRIQRREQSLKAEVDGILEKVAQHGLHSLTAREKRALRKATQHQRRAG